MAERQRHTQRETKSTAPVGWQRLAAGSSLAGPLSTTLIPPPMPEKQKERGRATQRGTTSARGSCRERWQQATERRLSLGQRSAVATRCWRGDGAITTALPPRRRCSKRTTLPTAAGSLRRSSHRRAERKTTPTRPTPAETEETDRAWPSGGCQSGALGSVWPRPLRSAGRSGCSGARGPGGTAPASSGGAGSAETPEGDR